MSSSRSGFSKGKKRKNEDASYDSMQSTLDDDVSNDGEAAIPGAAGRNAEKADEGVRL